MKPVHAASASAPPTLMRRTPSAAISRTLRPMSRATSHEHVERFRGNRLDERLDLCRRLWTRGEEHVCACRGVRLQPSDALAEGIWMAHVVALRSCGQQHVLARPIDRPSCGADALDRDRQLVHR